MTAVNPYARALRLALLFGGDALRASRRLIEVQLRQFEEEQAGAVAFWTSPLVPSEILSALGIHSTTPETIGAVLSSVGLGKELREIAELEVPAAGACSFQRCALGALRKGYVPLPRGFVTASTLCDDTPQLCGYLARRHGLEHFLLDLPQFDTAEARRYVEEQLGELVSFCEAAAGRRLAEEDLVLAIRRSNAALRHWRAAGDLRRGSRVLMPGASALRMAGGMILQKFGLSEGEEVLAELEGELRERAEAGRGETAGRRLLWLHLFPLFDRHFMPFVEQELRAAVVFDETSHPWWEELDEARPLWSLARKILSNPFQGGASRRAELAVRLARDYRADGVVHFSHLGCKALSGGVWLLREALRAEGIAFLELSGDCNDPAAFSARQARDAVEAFCERLG